MRKFILTAVASALATVWFANAASATEHHRRRHVAPSQTIGTQVDPGDAYDYYPGWGRPKELIYGVYPGLIYGGATSAPAGR